VQDHCYNTKVVRGILCTACNLAEGYLKTPERARRLLAYMEKNELFYYGPQANGASELYSGIE